MQSRLSHRALVSRFALNLLFVHWVNKRKHQGAYDKVGAYRFHPYDIRRHAHARRLLPLISTRALEMTEIPNSSLRCSDIRSTQKEDIESRLASQIVQLLGKKAGKLSTTIIISTLLKL